MFFGGIMKNFIYLFFIVLSFCFLLISCTTNEVNFDTLPDGTTIQGAVVPVDSNAPSTNLFLISSQYASEGFAFSSPNGPPYVSQGNPQSAAPSPPNVLCPRVVRQSNAPITFDIILGSSVCNVWFTKLGTETTAKVYDVSNNLLDTIVIPNGTQNTRINKCSMKKVELSGVNFCIDDLKSRDR